MIVANTLVTCVHSPSTFHFVVIYDFSEREKTETKKRRRRSEQQQRQKKRKKNVKDLEKRINIVKIEKLIRSNQFDAAQHLNMNDFEIFKSIVCISKSCSWISHVRFYQFPLIMTFIKIFDWILCEFVMKSKQIKHNSGA